MISVTKHYCFVVIFQPVRFMTVMPVCPVSLEVINSISKHHLFEDFLALSARTSIKEMPRAIK